jgi:hypothetical protein
LANILPRTFTLLTPPRLSARLARAHCRKRTIPSAARRKRNAADASTMEVK